MDVFREECQSDLLTFLRIICRMNLKLSTCSRKCNRIHTFCYLIRIKLIVYTDINALVFIAKLPPLSIGPRLKICIKRLRLFDLIHGFDKVKCHNSLICLFVFHKWLIHNKNRTLNACPV